MRPSYTVVARELIGSHASATPAQTFPVTLALAPVGRVDGATMTGSSDTRWASARSPSSSACRVATLYQWRLHGYGPRSSRISRYVRYDPPDVRLVRGPGRRRDPDGRQRKKAFARRVDAERFLSTITADVVRGTYVDPYDPTTFHECAQAWREAQLHRPTTRAHVETNLRRHAYPASATTASRPSAPARSSHGSPP